MKKEKIVLDLDKYAGGKKLKEFTPEEMAELLKPFQRQASELLKSTAIASEQLLQPLKQFALIQESLSPKIGQIIAVQVSMAKIMENTVNISTPMSKAFASMIDSRRIAQSLFDSIQLPAGAFKNAIIDINTLGSGARISKNSLVGLEFKSVRQTSETEAKIHSLAKTETSFKAMSIIQTADLSVVFSAIGSKLDSKLDKAEFAQEIANMKGILSEIKDAFGKTLPVMINDLSFDQHTLKLTIKGKEIPFQADTKQAFICRLLLINTKSAKKKIHIKKIVEAYGESFTSNLNVQEWDDIFYQAVRQINTKIAIATGIEEFIKVSKRFYEVNPKYHKLLA